MNVIEMNNLSFSYSKKSNKILENVSMKVPKGAIYGFLGANGAGKSTTMQLLTGSLPTSNKETISLFNKSLEKQLPIIFKKVGTLIESPSLYLHLSGHDNLAYMAKMKGVIEEEITNVLELVGLAENSKQKVKEYSLGMKQRLAIAFALLGKPQLLLLDEPINGLDPQGVIDIRNLLMQLNKKLGITIFISSHLLDEIERICTHIGILNKGRLVFDGTIEELKAKSKTNKQKIAITLKETTPWFEQLNVKYKKLSLEENTIRFETENKEEIKEILLFLLTSEAEILEMKTVEGLEDLFLKLSK
ncbi:ATP-binding cassette domain-containing protein [uncultured Tenacibaculum sp.]|uniref:ABC transporter ATP-binding protein n=1 Tax=uncultured Tenacibaculum sp. TaxID=174713 RepID=UPI002628D194|nr:ATP-binding cassette domain-containing protein [uncultured Tenacibaculum sp.]